MTIARKLALLVIVSLFGLLLLGGQAFYGLHNVEENVTDLADNVLPSVDVITNVQQDVTRLRLSFYQRMVLKDPAVLAAIDQQFVDLRKDASDQIALYGKTLASDESDRKMMEDAQQKLAAYNTKVDELLVLVRGGQVDAALAALPAGKALGDQLDAALKTWLDANHQAANESKVNAISSVKSSLIWVTIFGLAIAAVMLGLGTWIYRGITGPVLALQSLLADISSRLDFTLRARVNSHDEIGQALGAVNRLIESMEQSLQAFTRHAKGVAGRAEQMLASAREVASSSAYQSEAAASMAASIEQLTVSINHVAEQAREAVQASKQSGDLAVEGERVITEATVDIRQVQERISHASDKVNEVQQNSHHIDSVINVIKEVADQTNLLALNAAIEAARAGESGRGFAVVADEVRKLAERTAASTGEISKIVESMQQSTDEARREMSEAVSVAATAVEKANRAESSIGEIRHSARAAVTLVDQISVAIAEQSSASTLMSQQVEKVAQMTEENNAAAGSTAESAGELKAIVNELSAEVDRYRI